MLRAVDRIVHFEQDSYIACVYNSSKSRSLLASALISPERKQWRSWCRSANPAKVTCNNCQRTAAFKKAAQLLDQPVPPTPGVVIPPHLEPIPGFTDMGYHKVTSTSQIVRDAQDPNRPCAQVTGVTVFASTACPPMIGHWAFILQPDIPRRLETPYCFIDIDGVHTDLDRAISEQSRQHYFTGNYYPVGCIEAQQDAQKFLDIFEGNVARKGQYSFPKKPEDDLVVEP